MMGYALVLELPEELYQSLVNTAQQSGDTLKQIATKWLAAVIRQIWQAPLEPSNGVFQSTLSDWIDQHGT